MGAKVLGREDILSAQDIQRELVSCPEWGGDVYVRGMTGAERDHFEMSIVETRGKNTRVNFANMRAKLLALTLVDESGNLLFSDDDIRALGEKSAAPLDRLFSVARRLSGLASEDVEELIKN